MAEDVRARLLVRAICGKRGEDDAGRAEHHGDGPGPVGADSEPGGSAISRAGRDRDALRRRAGHGRRLEDLREPGGRDLQRVQDLAAPAAAGDVEQERPGCVRDVDRVLAGEPQPDVVLRQEDAADAGVGVRLVLPQPEELGRSESRERPVPGQLDEPREPDPLLDLGALGSRPLVVPEDRRANHAVLFVEGDEAVHLTGQSDSRDVAAELGERGLACTPPVLRVLLGPAGPRRRERIRALGARDDLALRRDGDRLDTGRPDVEPRDERHRARRRGRRRPARTRGRRPCVAAPRGGRRRRSGPTRPR